MLSFVFHWIVFIDVFICLKYNKYSGDELHYVTELIMRRVLIKHKCINKGDTRIKIKQKQRNETKRKKIVEVII